ncbi:adenylate/guanylate cyclase domain-containing protein [candidate division FCPU426 bacterium]|nr:adenylate/guanylate cyclase domain-containing protein [candidate division FCPU426 bacterium]
MAKKNTKTKFGLTYKITLLVISLVALIMVVVSYFSIYQEELLKNKEMDQRMTDVANMIAALKLIEPLAGERVAWPIFREFIKVVRNLDENILYISIIGNEGDVRAFTVNPAAAAALDPALEGMDETEEALQKLVQHEFVPGNTAKISGDIIVEERRVATVNIRFSLLSLRREIMMAKVRNILLTLVMMILGLGGAFWVSKTITRPIAELTEAMARVAKGDLGVTAAVKSSDEIGLLTQSFNLMVQELKEKVRIKDAFDVVADELKEVEKIKASFELYVSNEVQERFVDSSSIHLEGEGKRFPVTIFFADLTQIAQQASTQDAASLASALELYFRKLMSILFEYEGQVYKFTEHVFIAVFGIPQPHQDDDRRAVLSAVNIQKALAEMNKRRMTEKKSPLYISLGITSGEAIGSLISPRGMGAMEVVRDYLQFTQKMSNQPFSVVMVAGDIFRRVTNLIRGEKVEDLQMPDTGETLEVYRVTGAKF